MAFQKIDRRGRVAIVKQDRDSGIYYRWTCPDTGKTKFHSTGKTYNGRSVPRAILAEATTLSEKLDLKRKEKAGLVEPVAQQIQDKVTVHDAMTEAIKHSLSQSEMHRDCLKRYRDYFVDWLAERHPAGSMYWHEIKPSLVIQYMEAKAETVKPKTLRNYLSVITLTANHFVRLDPDRYKQITIKSGLLTLGEKTKNYLSMDQATTALEFAVLNRYRYTVESMMLGAFAGLNFMEMYNVTKADYDPTTGILQVRQKKNEYRPRKIPLVNLVRTFFDAEHAKLETPDSHFFHKRLGGKCRMETATYFVRYYLLRPLHEKTGQEIFKLMAPKDLRKTWINLSMNADIDGDFRRAYVGHKTENGRLKTGAHMEHYGDATAELLREKVVAKMEAKFPLLAMDYCDYVQGTGSNLVAKDNRRIERALKTNML